jgi:transposase
MARPDFLFLTCIVLFFTSILGLWSCGARLWNGVSVASLLRQSERRRTKPTKEDLYEVFCAVLYLLRTGCPWRFLPSDFPKWQTVYAYFAK